ncbi:MAG: hypothetical protein ACM3SY_07390 [Candidatus Omnitrophota bacterium]
MIHEKKIIQLLYRSLDNRLSQNEENILATALENSAELRREKEYLERQRREISHTAIHSFKPFFAERVMMQVNALAGQPNGLDIQTFYGSLVSVFRRVAIAGSAVCILLFFLNLGMGTGLLPEETFTLSDLTLQQILAIF